ncbi:MAG: hypothetical protein LBG71_00015 [Clostridiales Family XIII bacterium]|nr:hypothetical protein [Clostridiales Family XIII bacterium]
MKNKYCARSRISEAKFRQIVECLAAGRRGAADKYGEIVRKQQKEALEGMKDWSLFDAGRQPSGKVTGTKVPSTRWGKEEKSVGKNCHGNGAFKKRFPPPSTTT